MPFVIEAQVFPRGKLNFEHNLPPSRPSGLFTTGFNIQKFYVLLTLNIHAFCMDPRTSECYFFIQRELIGFYNRDGESLLSGTS